MKYYIFNNQIVGQADPNSGAPAGFTIADGPDAIIDNLYYDQKVRLVKSLPPRPETRKPVFFNQETNKWEEVRGDLGQPQKEKPQWDHFTSTLRGSTWFERVYGAAERTLKAQTAFTALNLAILVTRDLKDFEFAFAKMREAMSGISGIGDFTTEELRQIQKLLDSNGIPYKIQIAELPIVEAPPAKP